MKYSCAVITGASSGLGEEFAKQLASSCKTMVLVARRADRLDLLKSELQKFSPDLEVIVEVADLNKEGDIEAFVEKLNSGIYATDLLVNNAGLGDLGGFEKAEWEKLYAMLNLNMLVLTRLAHAVVPGMKKMKKGSILNVSSMASVLPIPDFAAYAATKSYVTSLSEALRLELMEYNINVTALCPGPVHTEFGDVATRNPEMNEIPMKETAFVTKELVVKEALAALVRNKPWVFPGFKIKLATLGIRLLPMPIVRLVMMRRPRKID